MSHQNLYQFLPPLLPDELDALRASIVERGIEVPIIVDQDGNIIDGFTRQTICEELRLFCPKEVRHFDSEAERFELSLRLNCQRRQFDRKQKRSLISAYLICDPQIADNNLAEIIGGVSKNTVAKVRSQLESTCQIDKLQTLRGKDGKVRPRKYKKIIANSPKEAEIAFRLVGGLPENCNGKTLDVTTAKRRVARQVRQTGLATPLPRTAPEQESEDSKLADVVCGDCIEQMRLLTPQSVSVVVTSPPYNLDVPYNSYRDDLPEEEYLRWLERVFQEIHRVLRNDGSFFLNIGSARRKPWTAMRVADIAGKSFRLQNEIIWVKSLSINGKTHGHFQPLSGDRFLNHNFEHIFHFTKSGDVRLDRLAVGVEYTDPSNLLRNTASHNRRCGGDVWFVPYRTITESSQRGSHPATFPIELAERCIKLHGVSDDCIVLDPFCGTGSTLLAAQRLGIRSVGIDLDADYCEQAKSVLHNKPCMSNCGVTKQTAARSAIIPCSCREIGRGAGDMLEA